MDEKQFKYEHHKKVRTIAHSSGIGVLVPDVCLDEYILENEKYRSIYEAWIQEINNSSLSSNNKSMKRKLASKKISDIFLTAFIINRVREKEQLVLAIEKWKLKNTPPNDLTLIDLIKWKYVNLYGWRRFDHSQTSYNYWVKTGLCPYTF